MLLRLLAGACLLAPQDGFDRWLDRLSDDDPETRDRAAETLAEGYAAWREPLEKRLAAAADPDLRNRLRGVLAEGDRRARRDRFAAALPGRLRKLYPGFPEALFSKDPDRRLAALVALGQTFGAEEKAAYPAFWLSPAEARLAIPEAFSLLDPDPSHEAARSVWVYILCGREPLLEDPAWSGFARRLFEDPSPSVREHAVMNLARHVAAPRDVMDLLGRWSDLGPNGRGAALREAVRQRVEEAYPFIRNLLTDRKEGEHPAGIILSLRESPLRPEALSFFDRHPDRFWGGTYEQLSADEATPILLKRLRDPRTDVISTLEMLASRGSEAAGDSTALYLGHSDEKVRTAALRALARTGSPRHAETVGRLLAVELGKPESDFWPVPALDLLVRWEAAGEVASLLRLLPRLRGHLDRLAPVLERHRPATAVEPLLGWLAGKDRWAAVAALDLLSRMGQGPALRERLETVRSLLPDPPDPYVQQVLAAASRAGLREFLPDAIRYRSRLHPSILASFMTADERRAALRSPESACRQAAVLATGAADPAAACADLAPLRADPDPALRRAIVAALQHNLGNEAGELLLQLAQDPDETVAREAAQAFFNYTRPQGETEDRLRSLLRHPSGPIRAHALRRFDRSSLPAELVDALRQDPCPEVRNHMMSSPDFAPIQDRKSGIEAALRRETDADKLLTAVFEARALPREEAVPLLAILLERALAENPSTVKTSITWSMHGESVTDLRGILRSAAEEAGRDGGLDPLLHRLLGSGREELEEAALWGLGRRGAVPLASLSDPRPALRKLAFKAAALAPDAYRFEDLLEPVRATSDESFPTALHLLGSVARPEHARRLLELAFTPQAERRKAVLEQVRRFPLPEFADAVAEFLDDNYYVVGTAAQFLRDAGAAQHLTKATLRAALHHPRIGARMAAENGLKDAIPLLLVHLDVPGNPSVEEYGAEVAHTLAAFGMKEHAPRVLAKLRAVHARNRPSYIAAYARLAGADAVPDLQGYLADPDIPTAIAAAEAIVDLGQREPLDGIRAAVRRDLHEPASARIIVRLRLADLAREALAKPQGERALALAARLGIPGTPERLRRQLELQPDVALGALQQVWGPAAAMGGWDGFENVRWGTVRALAGRIERQSGRKIRIAGAVPDGFHDRIVPGGTMRELLEAFPGKGSYYVDEDGVLVVDTREKVLELWKARLSR